MSYKENAKISSIISVLEKIMEQHGDIPCCVKVEDSEVSFFKKSFFYEYVCLNMNDVLQDKDMGKIVIITA